MDFANAMCEVVRRPLKSTSLTLPGCLRELTGKEDVIVVIEVADLINLIGRYKITFANVPHKIRGHICSMTNYNDKLL